MFVGGDCWQNGAFPTERSLVVTRSSPFKVIRVLSFPDTSFSDMLTANSNFAKLSKVRRSEVIKNLFSYQAQNIFEKAMHEVVDP